MPDANGRIKGTGWSRAADAAYERLELDRARREWLHNNAGAPFPPELQQRSDAAPIVGCGDVDCHPGCRNYALKTRPVEPDLMAALEASLRVPAEPAPEV
jgi:hypothetical protein